jgi:23S rRNA pseudouridine1911/1915/1917 synthase
MPTILLTPTHGDAGKRLDVYIAGAEPDLSRSQVKRLTQESRVRISGQPVGPSTKVHAGVVITVTMPDATGPILKPEPLRVPILHSDAEIIVVDKPAGLVVHPGAGKPGQTLVNQLISRFPELLTVGNPIRPGVVHRLDKDTSGALVVARSMAAYEHLVAQFAARSVEKTYLALVEGAPTVERGVINAPVGRHPTRRTMMSVVSYGKPATTHFAVLESLGRYTLLQVTPDTGRTHQIRVHLSAAGLPIAGDFQYGGKTPFTGLDRMFLHAFALGFLHPATQEKVDFRAPLADDLAQALRRCGSTWERNRQFDPSFERP